MQSESSGIIVWQQRSSMGGNTAGLAPSKSVKKRKFRRKTPASSRKLPADTTATLKPRKKENNAASVAKMCLNHAKNRKNKLKKTC